MKRLILAALMAATIHAQPRGVGRLPAATTDPSGTPKANDAWFYYSDTDQTLKAKGDGGNVQQMVATPTAKADLPCATAAGVYGRLAVGSNDQVLTADSAQPCGVKWADASGGSTYVYPITYRASGSSNGSTARADVWGNAVGAATANADLSGIRWTGAQAGGGDVAALFWLPPLTNRTGGVDVEIAGVVGQVNGTSDPAQFTIDLACVTPGTTSVASPSYGTATTSAQQTWSTTVPSVSTTTVASENLCTTSQMSLVRIRRVDTASTDDDNLLAYYVTFWVSRTF